MQLSMSPISVPYLPAAIPVLAFALQLLDFHGKAVRCSFLLAAMFLIRDRTSQYK